MYYIKTLPPPLLCLKKTLQVTSIPLSTLIYFQLHIDTGDSTADTAEIKPKEEDFFSTHEQSAAVQDGVIPTASVAAAKLVQNGNKVGGHHSIF